MYKHSKAKPQPIGTKRYYVEHTIVRSTYIDIPIDDDIVDHLDIPYDDFEHIEFNDYYEEVEVRNSIK